MLITNVFIVDLNKFRIVNNFNTFCTVSDWMASMTKWQYPVIGYVEERAIGHRLEKRITDYLEWPKEVLGGATGPISPSCFRVGPSQWEGSGSRQADRRELDAVHG